jgi:signal transduction histidine kinase
MAWTSKSAAGDGERLVLSVRDHGKGITAEAEHASHGMGLRNARARLTQLYGDEQSLTLQNAEGGGTDAVISLPFHTAADLKTTGEMLRP